MNILGLVYTSHDAGLALLTDGKPNVMFEEERFNRIKHTLKYPRLAMDAVFGAGGQMQLSDVDVITTPWNMSRIRRSLRDVQRGDRGSEIRQAQRQLVLVEMAIARSVREKPQNLHGFLPRWRRTGVPQAASVAKLPGMTTSSSSQSSE